MISLAGRDILHSWSKFVLTGIGLGLLIGVTLTMAGVYRGMVDDAKALLNNSGADIWVVQQGTQGPYAESSSLRDDVYRALLALPGISRAANVTYLTMQVRLGNTDVRAMVVGFEPGQPGEPGYLVAGRQITRSHYEAVADVKTGFQLGDTIRIRRHDYRVVGLTWRMVSSSSVRGTADPVDGNDGPGQWTCTAEPNPRIWGGGLVSPGGSRTRSGIGRLMHEQLMRLASDLEDRAAARFAISGAALAGLRFPKELALRSSLWVKDADWRQRFHQGPLARRQVHTLAVPTGDASGRVELRQSHAHQHRRNRCQAALQLRGHGAPVACHRADLTDAAAARGDFRREAEAYRALVEALVNDGVAVEAVVGAHPRSGTPNTASPALSREVAPGSPRRTGTCRRRSVSPASS